MQRRRVNRLHNAAPAAVPLVAVDGSEKPLQNTLRNLLQKIGHYDEQVRVWQQRVTLTDSCKVKVSFLQRTEKVKRV
jgi:hypothetical protein